MRSSPNSLPLLLSSLALVALGGCGGEDPPPTGDRAAALTTAADHASASVRTFAARVLALQGAVADLCVEPIDGPQVVRTQRAWIEAARAWAAVAPFFLGPLDDDLITPSILFIESRRQRGIDYTETVREAAEAALASMAPMDAAFFDALSFNEVGLLALEVLLFEASAAAGRATEPAAIAADYVERPRRCLYLFGVAGRLASRAVRVRDEWTVAFGAEGTPFAAQLASGELEDGSSSEAALLVALFEHLDYERRRKIEGVSDAQLSGEFFALQSAMLDSLRATLAGPGDAYGFLDELADRGEVATRERLLDGFEAASAAIEAEDEAGLGEAYQRLEDRIRSELPPALDVELGLNFSDGD